MTTFATVRADDPSLASFARDPRRLFGLGAPESYVGRGRYERLRDQWRHETAYLSWLDDIVRSPSAQAIARDERSPRWLAQDLRDSEEGARAIMGLLREILGRGPEIAEEELGRRDAMRTHWLTWLRAEGLL